MAKLKGPLFSQKASGSVGPVLTFSSRASGEQVRYQKKQDKTIYFSRLLSMMSYYGTRQYGVFFYGLELGLDK